MGRPKRKVIKKKNKQDIKSQQSHEKDYKKEYKTIRSKANSIKYQMVLPCMENEEVTKTVDYKIYFVAPGKLYPKNLSKELDKLRYHLMEANYDILIPKLHEQIKLHPSAPILYDYLSKAYQKSGDKVNAELWINKTYETFSYYIPARINLASFYLEEGNIEKVKEFIGQNLSLQTLYPEYESFHISEIRDFYWLVTIFYNTQEKPEQALKVFNQLENIDAESEDINDLRNILNGIIEDPSLKQSIKKVVTRLSPKTRLNKYKKFRQAGMALNSKIIKTCLERDTLLKAGRALGMVRNGTFIFNNDEESSVLMDFALHEYKQNGKNFIEIYQEKFGAKNDLEQEILKAMISQHTSLFIIKSVSKEQKQLTLEDLIDRKDIELTDISLSETARTGIVMFARLFSISDFNVTSGAAFLFPAYMKKQLIQEYKNTQKMHANVSRKLFPKFFNLHRQQGLNAQFL